ncbi:MAG: hypothetical protein FD169_1305 [Bacillota bacterium]|nr:MAG: hypothetical protein FD169_1305 [Bacillota bacterium]MBS3950600.1 DUF1003 domain-containing protein [Peptococcaceae bacterium]
MRNINQEYSSQASLGERLADRLAQVIGSWFFIAIFLGVVAIYIGFNCSILLGQPAFDKYPFVFLNLLLAIIAAIQAPIILMAQNRQGTRERLKSDIDFEITVRGEQEIQDIQRHLHRVEDDVMKILKILENSK